MRSWVRAAFAVCFWLVATPASAVTMDWVQVGNPSPCNPPECVDPVPYAYWISKYEVTNAQYAEFLNAVANYGPEDLYSDSMGSVAQYGGIARSGSPGSYVYTPIDGRENLPVNHVSFNDALRFVNWMNNGQPSHPEVPPQTEYGAYTFVGDDAGPRNAGATIVLPNREEWDKAAYWSYFAFDPEFAVAGFTNYPTNSNLEPTCGAPTSAPNHVSCLGVVGDLTPVGSYPGSPSSSGTFDQGGNVAEWTETVGHSSFWRVLRGMHDGYIGNEFEFPPEFEDPTWGFRVAMVPEPGTGLLVAAGLLGLAALRTRRG